MPFRSRPLVPSDNQTQIDRSSPANLKADRLETQQFNLANKNGEPRLTMNIDDNNTVRLTISSGTQNSSAILNVFEDDRTAFILRGPQERNRVSISTRKTGQPTIYMTEDANIVLANHKTNHALSLATTQKAALSFLLR